jgi:AcrR family transcriptional regulator
MAPDERRQAIIEASVELLLTNGPDLSTREIAKAAGVAEGTIFRVFETKDDLIHAAVHAAMQPTAALAALAELPPLQDLEQRVTDILSILVEEIRRTRALFVHLASAGVGPQRPHLGGAHPHRFGGPHEGRLQLFVATVAALTPYATNLSVEPPTAARLLNALAFATSFNLTDTDNPATPESMAAVALHGIAEGEK